MDKPNEQIAEQVIKSKRSGNGKNSPVIGDNGITVLPGENSKYAAVLSELNTWKPVDKSSVPALQERFVEYLTFCANNDIKIGNQMCYLALGISKDDVYNWEHGVSRSSEHCDFIKKIKQFCGAYRESLMQDGKVNPIVGIFWQKNYDGMKDVQDLVFNQSDPLGDKPSPEELQRRIESSVVVDE